MDTYETIVCTLDSGAIITFDIPDPTVDDQTETITWYEVFTRSVGA